MTKQGPAPQAKRLDFKSKRFVANGHTYIIHDYLTIGRDVHFTNLVPKMVFGADFKSIFDTLSKVYALCTTGDSSLAAIAKISTLALNQMEAIKDFGERGYPLYYELCALFINREDEDETKISQDLINAKIKDWEVDGYVRDDFFLLAINSVIDLKRQWLQLQEAQNQM